MQPSTAAVPARRRSRLASWSAALLAVLAAAVAASALTLTNASAAPVRFTPTLLGAPAVASEFEITPPSRRPRITQPTQPIDVPSDPYAKEPVVRLGTLRIPKLGVDQQLMHGVTLNNIDHGPSHWPGSAWPGDPGNTVVAGHRVTNSRPFRNIDRLVPGDRLEIEARGVRATYAMVSNQVVPPSATYIANPTAESILTIFACHPPGSARQRFVVRFALVGVERLDV